QFGIETCRVKRQPLERMNKIRDQISSAYPVLHERALSLYLTFLHHKIKFGSDVERALYKDMSLVAFVQRLLTKRCVYFFGDGDSYLTMDGQFGFEGFEAVGTAREVAPLTLANVLSYDEIKLAALLYVSCYSEFINSGRRNNAGTVPRNKSNLEPEGLIIGLIGGRFERPNVMEYQDIMITETQNTVARGYGIAAENATSKASDLRRIWREFYGEPRDFVYGQVAIQNDDKERFEVVYGGYFDHQVMRKRYSVTFDTLLLEAQGRAREACKPAYIHVVGFGLGVGKLTARQERTFFESFEERLRVLSDQLNHIAVVHFSWFHLSRVSDMYDGAKIPAKNHPEGFIKIRISSRNPNLKLEEDMLPVTTYAWDANALPGNEFWAGILEGTGDPAAACSTLISELQNPHINKEYMSGNNLHIASLEHGLLHVGDYARKVSS
ncbi:hypothetical protein KR018_007261, partial [Drosophila ironensis]